MKHIILDIAREATQTRPFVLTTIVRHAGSSPRSTGTRMIVYPDKTIAGTIGGGLLEAQVIQGAADVLDRKADLVRSFQFDAKKAGDMGMICGGQVDVLFQYVSAPDEHLGAVYRAVGQALESRKRAWLVTRLIAIRGAVDGSTLPLQCALLGDGSVIGRTDVNPENLLAAAGEIQGKDPRWVSIDGNEVLIEPVEAQGTVFIFGAGHVSQQMAPLTTWVGFHTIVVDDRAEFANRDRFPTADQVIAPASMDRAFDGLEIGPESYLVIVTRGHKDDMSVLEQALRTEAGYIGMIGSKRKRELIYQALLANGFTENDLKRVHSPIGLPIGAETPEEIAISILGELIQIRAEKR